MKKRQESKIQAEQKSINEYLKYPKELMKNLDELPPSLRPLDARLLENDKGKMKFFGDTWEINRNEKIFIILNQQTFGGTTHGLTVNTHNKKNNNNNNVMFFVVVIHKINLYNSIAFVPYLWV